MLFLDVNKNKNDNAERLQEMLDNKKNVFVLVYMIGCTPCKNTLPEWNKLNGCQELEQLKNNNDVIVANVEQSMCEKMHHKDLENIMSFPTIKHIQHNDVHDYNDERTTTAFSKWIKSLIKDDGKLRDLNNLVSKKQYKINHGNIDILFKSKPTKKRKVKFQNRFSRTKRYKPKKKVKVKAKSIKKQRKANKTTTTKQKTKNKRKKTKSSNSKSRRQFQKSLSYSKSLHI